MPDYSLGQRPDTVTVNISHDHVCLLKRLRSHVHRKIVINKFINKFVPYYQDGASLGSTGAKMTHLSAQLYTTKMTHLSVVSAKMAHL